MRVPRAVNPKEKGSESALPARPKASARHLRYPTQPLASGSCASARKPALLPSGSSANALRFPLTNGVPRAVNPKEKGSESALPTRPKASARHLR